ncbi:MAG: flavodoxin family protein [Dehalococcoidia bacterium]|nr:flavodoxin family protein [Dehalococcoidia bacterium]
MTKQVIIVLGSPRKNGNCAILAERAPAGVRACGAKAEMVYLHGLDMEPCNACDACQTATEADCIINDEMTTLLPRLRQADSLLIASPVYWFTFTAQTKLFIDRAFYALNGPQGNALKGKPLGLIMTYGDNDPFTSGAVNALRTFQDICRFIEAPVAGLVYGSASGVGDIQKQPDILQQAYQLGQRLGAG